MPPKKKNDQLIVEDQLTQNEQVSITSNVSCERYTSYFGLFYLNKDQRSYARVAGQLNADQHLITNYDQDGNETFIEVIATSNLKNFRFFSSLESLHRYRLKQEEEQQLKQQLNQQGIVPLPHPLANQNPFRPNNYNRV